MVKTIPKEHRSPKRGNSLVIDIEKKGIIYKIEIICPGCGSCGWWLSEDNTKMYCDKCGAVIGRLKSDIADMENVGWAI